MDKTAEADGLSRRHIAEKSVDLQESQLPSPEVISAEVQHVVCSTAGSIYLDDESREDHGNRRLIPQRTRNTEPALQATD